MQVVAAQGQGQCVLGAASNVPCVPLCKRTCGSPTCACRRAHIRAPGGGCGRWGDCSGHAAASSPAASPAAPAASTQPDGARPPGAGRLRAGLLSTCVGIAHVPRQQRGVPYGGGCPGRRAHAAARSTAWRRNAGIRACRTAARFQPAQQPWRGAHLPLSVDADVACVVGPGCSAAC